MLLLLVYTYVQILYLAIIIIFQTLDLFEKHYLNVNLKMIII